MNRKRDALQSLVRGLLLACLVLTVFGCTELESARDAEKDGDSSVASKDGGDDDRASGDDGGTDDGGTGDAGTGNDGHDDGGNGKGSRRDGAVDDDATDDDDDDDDTVSEDKDASANTADPCDACDAKRATCEASGKTATCTCRDGYEDVNDDGSLCKDIDECKDGLATCHAEADCTNNEGSYSCACKPGWNGDGVNSCQRNALCADQAGSNCAATASCMDIDSESYCVCGSGYEGAGETCENTDECERNSDDCDPLAECADTTPGFACACPDGYEGAGHGANGCTDIDECDDDNGGCEEQCENSAGSYACSCPAGYDLDEDGQCHGWTTSQNLKGDIGPTTVLRFASNRAGVAFAAWIDYSSPTTIWAARVASGSWASPVSLRSDNNTWEVGELDIAVDDSGDAYAVWLEDDGTRFNLWASRYTGGSWGSGVKIESGDGDARTPQIVGGSAGNAFVTWAQIETSTAAFRSWARPFSAGTWGTAVKLDADGAGGGTAPQIAMNASGNAVAVWEQYSDQGAGIWAKRYTSGSWGAAVQLDTDDIDDGAGQPQVGVDSSGNAVAVWHQSDGTRYNIWARRYAAGAWGTARKIETEDLASAFGPALAVDDAGNAFAVWPQHDGTRNNVWANRCAPDGTWDGAVKIETGNDTADGVAVAVDDAGNAFATWAQGTTGNYGFWVNRFVAGDWGTALKLSTASSNSSAGAVVAADAAGKALAVWGQTSGDHQDLWWSRYY